MRTDFAPSILNANLDEAVCVRLDEAAALTLPVALYARARRAATGWAGCELWGLCARLLAIEIGEGPPR
jgi:hypothetical protein